MKTPLRAAALLSALMLTLAALAGCDAPVSSAAVASSVGESTPQVAIDLPEFTDPSVLNTCYTRQLCAAVTEFKPAADFFPATSNALCAAFVRDNYAAFGPGSVSADFVSGGTAKAAQLGLEGWFTLNVGKVTFTLSSPEGCGLTPDAEGFYTLYLQPICERRAGSDELWAGDYRLLGFVTNAENPINSASQLARFLRADPAYADVQVVRPEPPEGMTAYNINDYTDRPVFHAAMLDGKLAYLEKAFTHGMYGDTVFRLQLTDPATGTTKLLGTYSPDDYNFHGLYQTAGGNLALRVYTSQQGEYTLFCFNSDGETVEDSLPGETREFALSDAVSVYETNKGVYVDRGGSKELLLTNVLEDDGDMPGDFRSHALLGAVDNHRFVYSAYGYEWLIGTFIYDLDTGESAELAFEEGEILSLLDYRDGMAVLQGDLYSGSPTARTYVADLTGSSPGARELCSADGCEIAGARISADGRRIGVLHNLGGAMDAYTAYAFEIYDAESLAPLTRLDTFTTYCQPENMFEVGDKFVVTTQSSVGCDTYLYAVQIP